MMAWSCNKLVPGEIQIITIIFNVGSNVEQCPVQDHSPENFLGTPEKALQIFFQPMTCDCRPLGNFLSRCWGGAPSSNLGATGNNFMLL